MVIRLAPFVMLVSIAAMPLCAQPAAPPSDAPFACLFDGATAEQRALAGAAASQRLTDAPQDGEQRGGAALDSILTALPRCAETGHWTQDQRELAQHYILAQLAREDMRRRYAAQGVDLAFLDEARTATFDDLVARLRAQGVTGDRPDSAQDIVFIYLELARHVDEIRGGFANSNYQPR